MTRRPLRGWLFAWAIHLWCGMVYGHEYVAVSPEIQGRVVAECKHCGRRTVL